MRSTIDMRRIMIIGCPGSGKSTFARALHRVTALPLHHLDMMYWNADRTTVPKDVFLRRLTDVLARPEWIIDGNYGATMELRLQAADTVFFLDLPTEVCLAGITARKGKPRPDMPWVEYGKSDEEFVTFIKEYNTSSRPRVLQLLEQYRDRKVVIFHTHQEIDAYLCEIEGA